MDVEGGLREIRSVDGTLPRGIEPAGPSGEETLHESGNWLERMILSLLCSKRDSELLATPDEMIDEAAKKAFRVSTALGLVPGPFGMATILPEVLALARLQIDLICGIAGHYGKREKVSREILLLILGNALGVTAGEAIAHRVGSRLVVKSVNTRVVRGLAGKIGTRIVDEAAKKAVGRWVPMITAPLFGYFSRSLTRRIGREANRLFSRDLA